MIRDADQRRGTPSPAQVAGAAGDFADHTSAVLAACRELTQMPGPALDPTDLMNPGKVA
jgi:hypothetical protein